MQADIQIKKANLENEHIKYGEYFIENNKYCFNVPEAADFKVSNGDMIEIDIKSYQQMDLINAYIIGICMGAILHQRNMFLLHSSCVTDGKDTILIMGKSGAGKSTTASEFISHGWKLMNDDVSLIQGFEEGIPYVQSSYPAQRLWLDSLENYPEILSKVSL